MSGLFRERRRGFPALLGALLFALAARAEPAEPRGIASCAPCHGADGIGRDAEIPNLAGQNGPYLYNQLKAFKSGARKHPEMNYMSRRMSDQELRQMADYFAGLPPR